MVTLRKRVAFLTKTLLPSYTNHLNDTAKQTVTAAIVQPGHYLITSHHPLPVSNASFSPSTQLLCCCVQ